MTPENLNDLQQRIKKGEFLPTEFRDFHDQKALFKTFFDWYKKRIEANEDLKRTSPALDELTWVDVHIFMIDHFLAWMAYHGYKIQRWSPKCGTYEINAALEDRCQKEINSLKLLLQSKDKEANGTETPETPVC